MTTKGIGAKIVPRPEIEDSSRFYFWVNDDGDNGADNNTFFADHNESDGIGNNVIDIPGKVTDFVNGIRPDFFRIISVRKGRRSSGWSA